MELRIDPSRTRIAINTFATGIMSALAHDLEVVATRIEGTARDGDAPGAQLKVFIDGLRVEGVLRRGHVDRHTLKDSEREEIERRIQRDVFKGGSLVEVQAEGRGNRASFTLITPSGRATFDGDVRIAQRSETEWAADGSVELSLQRLNIREVKGPLGVIKVKDGVQVRFNAVFVAV